MVLKHFPVPVFGLAIGLLIILGQVFFVDSFSNFWINFTIFYQQEKPLSVENFKRGVLEAQTAFFSLPSTYQAAAVTAATDGSNWWNQFIDYVSALWQTIIKNWSDFWSGEGDQPPINETPAQVASSSDLSALKADLLRELNLEIKKQVDQAALSRKEGLANQGVVVIPEGGSASEVSNMFSDPVQVRFDGSSQSGVITPTFRNRQGSSYIFLLTPIKR